MLARLKSLFSNNKRIIENLSYISILEIFVLVSPLLTYPYLIKVLGESIYGIVIIAQAVVAYFSIFVNLGFRTVSARQISIYRDSHQKLSDIVSSVLLVRLVVWGVSLIVYMLIVNYVDDFSNHKLLFILSFGATLNELLFPQFYFQGIEKMKYISIINIAIKAVFIVLIFVLIKDESDYIMVPLLTALGFLIGGIYSLYIIFCKEKINFVIPSRQTVKELIKEASPLFATDLICVIKDRLNYILIGRFIGYDQVVTYDLGVKFTALLSKPAVVMSTVLLPVIAKNRNKTMVSKVLILILFTVTLFAFAVFVGMDEVLIYFNLANADPTPVKVFLLAPIFLSISSYIASNYIIAFNKNRYILYSIIVTTIVYLISLLLAYLFFDIYSVITFVLISVVGYFAELLYRLYVFVKK